MAPFLFVFLLSVLFYTILAQAGTLSSVIPEFFGRNPAFRFCDLKRLGRASLDARLRGYDIWAYGASLSFLSP